MPISDSGSVPKLQFNRTHSSGISLFSFHALKTWIPYEPLGALSMWGFLTAEFAQATGKFPLQTRDPCDHDKRGTRHANTTWRLHHERKIRENLHTFILIYIQQAKGKTIYVWKCLEAPWLVHIQLKEFGMMAHTSTSSYFYQSPSRFFLLHVPFLIPTPNPKYFQQRSHCHTSRILCLQELWSSTGDLGQLQLRFRLQFDSKGNANRVQ